jgi:hypothetical protein
MINLIVILHVEEMYLVLKYNLTGEKLEANSLLGTARSFFLPLEQEVLMEHFH